MIMGMNTRTSIMGMNTIMSMSTRTAITSTRTSMMRTSTTRTKRMSMAMKMSTPRIGRCRRFWGSSRLRH